MEASASISPIRSIYIILPSACLLSYMYHLFVTVTLPAIFVLSYYPLIIMIAFSLCSFPHPSAVSLSVSFGYRPLTAPAPVFSLFARQGPFGEGSFTYILYKQYLSLSTVSQFMSAMLIIRAPFLIASSTVNCMFISKQSSFRTLCHICKS